MGVQRELKKALEAFWSNKVSADELKKVAADLRQTHWQTIKDAGIEFIPSGDFSFYDHVLDTAVTFGVIPERYRHLTDPLTQYFAMARGVQDKAKNIDIPALEMTKWFDTNYHYIVPELAENQPFKLDASRILGQFAEAKSRGIVTRPVVLGPVSFLLLSKSATRAGAEDRLKHLAKLLPQYQDLLGQLKAAGALWVQLDEPCLALELDPAATAAYRKVLPEIAAWAQRPKVMLTTYFEALKENTPLAFTSGLEGVHIDLVRAPEQLDTALAAIDSKTMLSLGLIDGRNIWRTDLDRAQTLLKKATQKLGDSRVVVASSCSLLHTPFDLDYEKTLDPEVRSWLAFSKQKLHEIKALSQGETEAKEAFATARAALKARRESPRTTNPAVRERCEAVTAAMLSRVSPYPKRATIQHKRFNLPNFPTTTIGSFPQTGDVRSTRASWRAGKLSDADYNTFLKEETKRCIERQEKLGLDVLVHGEFERTDMVEYFGEQLAGFAFTANGWVQSYGSRCVKPPVIFGDVARPEPMTVAWAKYAQSLSKAPVKGMLTGPVTILQWSFVRDDQPRSATCQQIALALRSEVTDLEAAGISMIQVDEPAIREGLPLRRSNWDHYLKWAVDCFRLSTASVRDETQIHTHMCYSEFADILKAIAEMDADVLSIETSRSHEELLSDFERFAYPNEIGLGVYDIHSPRIPTSKEITSVLEHAAKLLPAERLWVNPDCGLKTRAWSEVEPALTTMIAAAKEVRLKTLEAGKR